MQLLKQNFCHLDISLSFSCKIQKQLMRSQSTSVSFFRHSACEIKKHIYMSFIIYFSHALNYFGIVRR